MAPHELSSGAKLLLTEATSANSTNLEQASAEESTKQVLMGKSREQSLVQRPLRVTSGQKTKTFGLLTEGVRANGCAGDLW